MALPPTQTPYSPGDFTALRKDIFDQAIQAIGDSSRVENDNYVLSLDGVEYDGGVPEYSKRDQKNAVYNNKSLSASIRGRWVLTDKATGQVVSKSSLRKLMEVPYLTERGTFIRNGSEVTLPIQMRLVPGIYAIMGENGEAKAQINTQPGTGRAMQLTMNPANPVFKLKAGTRNYSLYPILKHAGVKDTDLQEAWGKEIFDANYKDFVKGGGWYTGDKGDNPDDNPYERIAQDVFGGKIDPINAKMTFGEAFDTVDPNVLTKTATRLLALTRGEIDSDNRDSLENQRFVMAPDMIAERIRKDAGGTMRNILWKATKDGNVDRIPPAALSRYIHSLFTDSGLAQVIEETNLLDAYQRATKITRMGEGGISSIDSAPMSSRMVHNTYKAFVDPVSSVESLRVGLDTQAAINVLKGNDGLIYSPLINAVSGRKQLVSSIESSVVPVAFAEYRNSTLPVIPAMVGNSLQYLPRKDIKYFVPNGDSLFSLSSNLVPMKAGIKAGRLLMAQKHQTQAMALSDRMAPYVQTMDPSGENVTVEKKYGNIMGAIRAEQEGKVLDVTPDEITVRQGDGTTRKYSLYDNFPLNRRSLVTNIPSVTKGDMIKPGQLLAASNYTDKDGTSALGTQLRTGWLSYKGHNNLDGIVISESAAKKLTSEYLYHHDKDKEDGVQFGKDLYAGAFPTKFTKAQLDTIDNTGAAKPGTVLHKGDPIILAMSKRVPGPQTLYRTLSKDDAVTWENEFPGKVLDVVDGKDGIKVFTEAQVPAQVGDKISTRFASKGTIALILPDDKMPRNKEGEALQVLLSPTGIVSRVNSAQLVEAALGKVSAKTGKTYKLPGFMDESLIDFAERELKAAGLEDKEDLIDPETGNIIPQVKTGNSYITKFHHTSESKEGARSTGGYSADELPSGSGHDSAKTLGGLLLGAFVGHDSSEVLKDMKLVKGQRNDEFWRDFRSGRTPRTPNSPLIYDKFLAHLEASGIRVKREGDDTNIFAMTNDDVKTFTNGEVTSADTFTSKTFTPAKGGLFDPAIFGPNGDQWGYMTLPEPIPNPVMEDVIKVLLNVTEDEYRGILGGIKKLPDGSTGASGLKNYLSTINPKVGIANALQVVRSGKGAKRDKAVKQLRYYTAMDRQGVTPDDFMLDRIPVLPPRFRRVTESGGMMMIPDANYLYKAMKDTADDYVQAKEAGLPPDALAAGRLGVYDAFKAITGLGDPTLKALQEKEVGGLLKWVFGKGSPKFGGFQRSVVGGKLDVSGRAVIDIDPSLRLDEVGLPEGQAWGLYRDFTIRKLAQAGMPVLQATKEVVNKSARAKEMMKRVMNERPLIMTRAPALHKFSVVALKPKLIEGHTLMLNPVIEGPLNADVDGNCCDFDTEIILQSALNNPVFEAIVSSMEKRGMKKTLTGDTEMLTSKSMVMIREKGKRAIYVGPIGEVPRIGDPIKDKNGADVYRFPDGVKILSFSDKAASFGWHDVTSLTVESDSEAVEVEIGNETVIVSPNESLAVFDRLEGGLKKARPVESIGAFVPKMKQSPLPFGKEGHFDMGWLHGAFIGDGWLSGNYVGFTKMEERKRARFIEVLEKVIGRKPNWREYAGKAGDNKYADSVKTHFNDPGVVAHFNDYNFYNWDSAVGNDEDGRTRERSSLHKQVPPEMIINGTEEYLWGVLSGLIDTDGSICKNTSLENPRYYASLSTCSPFLADTMQDLCFRLGLRCGKTTSVHKKGGKRKVESVEYTLHLSSVDAYYHLDKIRCVGDREESLINEWKHHTEPVERKDIIPLSINERKTIRELFPPRIKENLSLYSAVGKDAVMRSTLMLRLSQLEKESSLASLVARIRNTGTVWERVKKVTAVERRDVFDFCVPETKVFVVNRGLVIWDTMTYYVPVTKKAVRDAYQKMMPSKNLLSARNFTAHYLPQEEYILGAYISTRKGTGPVKRTFKTEQEAVQAYKRGEIDVDDNVQITG